MTTPILHHYPNSPFAEKVRAILGYKGIDYRSVIIPVIMPKPDLVALTGGYRRTPVMQMGANIYCDTRRITQVLDGLKPAPTLIPPGQEATVNMLAQWADQHLFAMVVALAFSPAGLDAYAQMIPKAALDALLADRGAMRQKGLTARIDPAVAESHISVYLAQLESQLSNGQEFMFGTEPSLADFSIYHCLWFIKRNPGVSAIFDPFDNVVRWINHMSEFGRSKPTEISGQDAIDIAKAATIVDPTDAAVQASGVSKGDRVAVIATDIGIDPVVGELVAAAMDEIAIRRVDPAAGELMVHFPTIGYHVQTAN